jgi:hypothetical protein
MPVGGRLAADGNSSALTGVEQLTRPIKIIATINLIVHLILVSWFARAQIPDPHTVRRWFGGNAWRSDSCQT